MAPDEFYDAIGRVFSYVISAGDTIDSQGKDNRGVYFKVERENTNLIFNASPNDRYFTLSYKFSLTSSLKSAYMNDNKLLSEHKEEYNVDSDVTDELLDDLVAFRRLEQIDLDNAFDKIEDGLTSTGIHTDCRITSITCRSPFEDEDRRTWDGVKVSGLLYPYENEFGPRDYEQVAQNVLSVGSQVDSQMEKLELMEEVGFESISNI